MIRFASMKSLCAVIALSAAWVMADGPLSPATSKPSAGMAPLEIKTPRPAYVGTPKKLPPGVRPPPAKPRAPFYAPIGAKNLALKRPVTSSDKEPVIGQLAQITDGEKEGTEGSWVELGPGLQWVQIDLGAKANIYAIIVWHHHADPRVYRDVVVQVADDEDFISNVKTVFNNDNDNSSGLGLGKDQEYVEFYEGELIDCKGIVGKYVRCYSKGNTSDDQNHYTEVEVYGIPAK